MTVEAPVQPNPAETPAAPRADHTLRNLVMTSMLILVVLLFLGVPGRNNPSAGQLPPGVVYNDPSRVTLFFSRYQGSESITEPVVRPVPANRRNERLAYAMQQLLAGPSEAEKQRGLYSEIPPGTRLLGVHEQGRGVVIDLSAEFAGGGGSNSIEQRFEEVRQTVLAVERRRNVTLAVEGEPLRVLGGEGLEVPEALQGGPQ